MRRRPPSWGPSSAFSAVPAFPAVRAPGRPVQQLSRLELEELAQSLERVGVQPAERPRGARHPVRAGIAQPRAAAEGVRGDAALSHEVVQGEADHGTFRGWKRRL